MIRSAIRGAGHQVLDVLDGYREWASESALENIEDGIKLVLAGIHEELKVERLNDTDREIFSKMVVNNVVDPNVASELLPHYNQERWGHFTEYLFDFLASIKWRLLFLKPYELIQAVQSIQAATGTINMLAAMKGRALMIEYLKSTQEAEEVDDEIPFFIGRDIGES